MSADIKKPPVAPKPKFVIHPPVAPKPESLIGNVLQASKKPKPVIAPKPKVLKSSSFREPRTPSAFNKNASLEELKGNRSESLDFLNCKNGPSGEDHNGPSYIISMCSCNFKCTHKLGNGENLYNTRTVFEQLEKLSLENTEICRQPTPSPKTRWKRDTRDDRGTNANQIVLNSCVLETNVKNAFCRNILSNSCHFKHTDPNKDAQGNGSLCKSQEDLRRVGSDQSLSSSKECTRKVNPSKLNGDVRELHKPGRSPKGGKKTAYPTDQDHAGNCKTDNARTMPESVNDACPQAKPSDPSAKVQPVPKPRTLRVACLIRQDCIDSPGDGTSELVCSEARTVESAEPVLKKLTKINVLGESVSYQEEPRGTASNVNEETISLHGCEGTSLIEVSAGSENSDLQKGCSLAATEISIVEENVDRALNQDQRCLPNLVDQEDDSSDPGTFDKRSSFIRCCSLSMSLPKQLKITCNQHLSASSGFESTTPKKDNELPLKPEGSPRVAPKKPQRHSLPAAGPLKKAASEELVEKRCYVSNGEPNTQAVVNEIRLRHALAKEHSVSASHDLPKRTSEKPVWKLHRPIPPFSCSPESLKASSSNEKSTFVTKPRAKSLSSVDMERIDKPNKDPPKKSTFKKLLNMKLSVCIMKSDFQRFLCKGSQSGDGSSDRLSSGEGKAGGQNVSSSSPVGDRKTKPAKAQSADSYSPESQKKRLTDKCQLETSSRHRSGSLGDQPTFLVENPLDQPLNFVTNHCEVEYENVRHYDEIPEYENLPFTLHSDENTCYEWQNSSSVEDYDTTVYEMQDPYEGAERRLLYDSRSSEEDPAAELSIVHSDEEVVNSSDDEGSSSDSSKGDLDQLEDRLSKRAGKKTKVYHIAKEIMSSEKVFVDVLKLLHIDFRDAVAHASRQLGKSVIEDRTLNQILYYLPQLYELNRDVLRELEERMANWSDQQKIADIFVTKGPYLKMYSTYIREFEKNIALLDEQCRRNPGFAAVVKAFEMSPRCANLALKHYLLKPVQRIPQYRLLLTDYLKNILEESSDYRDTQAALAVVIEVANHANDIMKQGDNFQKLMQIQYSLNGHHEIVQPGRVFLKEGTLMKLSRKVMQPRMFFLFNDALLYSTPVQSGMYKLNNMLSLAGMKVRKPTQEAYQNELNIESVERSFILSASSATERDGWLEAISQAIEEYTKKRITFNPSKSLEEAEQEHEKEDSPLGTKAPIWIPDTRATMCMSCTSEFTLTWRRHHCRACGKIVCQACSANKHSLEYLKNQPERVCDHCYGELLKQDHQCTLKTGSPGNHKSPSSALSTVLQNIPSVRKMKKIPAALKEVSASTEDSSMSGYLYRSKGQKKPWKHLWFVIKNKVLYTYAASEDVAALESQPLLGFTVTEVKDESSESRVFQLLHKNTLFYVFKADDQHSTERWLEAFQEATVL